MRYEKSANALNAVLAESFFLNVNTLENMRRDSTMTRPNTLYAYTQGLVRYLEGKRSDCIQKADTDAARRIEKVYRKALLTFFKLDGFPQ